MEGKRPVRALTPDISPVFQDKELQGMDGLFGGRTIRHQQLVAAGRALQLLPQSKGDLLVDGDGAVHAAKATPLQFHGQLLVGKQLILGLAHSVVEELNGCQVGLNGGGGLAALLHPECITGQVLAADVLQLLQMMVVRQKRAELLERLVVVLAGAVIALWWLWRDSLSNWITRVQ